MPKSPDLTPRAIEAGMRHGCPKEGEVARLYAARVAMVESLKDAGCIDGPDLDALDRTGRSQVASECWGICTATARISLLTDAHHFVRSAAAFNDRNDSPVPANQSPTP